MAEVSSISQLHSQSRVTTSYIPASPPKAPKEISSYSRFLQDAPYSALSGINVDGRVPERHLVLPRNRERRQVGESNRWRLPERLYSDLLGKAQALKAINMPYNSTMVRIMTGMNHIAKPKVILPQEIFRPQSCPSLAPPEPTDKGYNNKVSQAADVERVRRKMKMKDTFLPNIPKSVPSHRKLREDSQVSQAERAEKSWKESNQSDLPALELAATHQDNGPDLEDDNLDKGKGTRVSFVDDC